MPLHHLTGRGRSFVHPRKGYTVGDCLLCMYYGSEFCAKAVREWLDRLDVAPSSSNQEIRGRTATARASIASREIFYTLEGARVLIRNWRREYNTIRPHRSLDYRAPAPQTLA